MFVSTFASVHGFHARHEREPMLHPVLQVALQQGPASQFGVEVAGLEPASLSDPLGLLRA